MPEKITAAQQRRIDELRRFIKVVEHVRKLVAELESSRAAPSRVIDSICSSIARELSQLRQRAMTTNVGTLADTAGALGILAGRGGGINLKIRGLSEGVHTMMLQLDHSLQQTLHPEKKES